MGASKTSVHGGAHGALAPGRLRRGGDGRRREKGVMRSVVMDAPREIGIRTTEEPGPLGSTDVLVRPEIVGICGSDVHLYTGERGTGANGHALFPRVPGHEASAIVVDAGDEARRGVAVGERVAVWPLTSCGRCVPCRAGRPNVCTRSTLIGVHTPGALADLLAVPAAQVFPVGALPAALTSFVEPMSIAVHAVARAQVATGETVVVLGGGAIGQAAGVAARARGCDVVVVEPLASRRRIAMTLGASVALDPARVDVGAEVDGITGGDGAAAVIDTTGVPAVLRDAVALVAAAGRVVVVGLADGEVRLPYGTFTGKECDVRGSTCQDRADMEEAIRLVTAEEPRLAPHLGPELAVEQVHRAFVLAADHPDDALKVLVRVSR